MPPLRIAIPIFPGCDLIDVAATLDPLRRIPEFWSERPMELDLVAATLTPVMTWQQVTLGPTKTFDDYEDATLDVLLVPGAPDVSGATGDSAFMQFVKDQASRATWVTSVCTGALRAIRVSSSAVASASARARRR